MENYRYQIKILFKRLLIIYLIYFFCRLLFFIYNKSLFASVDALSFLADCFYGLRFDTFSVFASNSLFILLSILPFSFFYNNSYQKVLKWIFIITNSIFISTNCIDIGYFQFIKKRSSSDLIHQLGGQTDVINLLPHFIKDFWWILLAYILFIVLIVKIYNKIKVLPKQQETKITFPKALLLFLIFLFLSGLTVLGIRGGLQRIPIDAVDAGGMVKAEDVPIVLNTPFTLIKSLDKETLNEYAFYDEKTLKQKFNPIHQYQSAGLDKKNVVVIILESFSKEYTKLGKTTSYTPFLDSLMQHSLVFTNAYANGAKSIEGIPAILSSMPSLCENPFINSAYSNNYQTSFATVLKPEGYTNAFFHGGINGTMNFDSYSKLAGYDYYFGKNEYNNDADFDGFWGIWDEPFLQYSIKKMNELKEPFHSSIFTLSSHHPYYVPEKYKNKFPKGHYENSESIGYADYALKLFFNSAKKTNWYKNTLFILVADHTGLSDHLYYTNMVGLKSIPIVFFKPDNSLARNCDSTFSQIDILPSTLNLLGYNKPFFSFGQSYLNRTDNNCYFYNNSTNFLICDTLLLCYNKMKLYSVTNLRRDSGCTINCFKKYPLLESRFNGQLEAFVQTYNHTLISNTGVFKPK